MGLKNLFSKKSEEYALCSPFDFLLCFHKNHLHYVFVSVTVCIIWENCTFVLRNHLSGQI